MYFSCRKMAGSWYDRTTNINRSNIDQDSWRPADLLHLPHSSQYPRDTRHQQPTSLRCPLCRSLNPCIIRSAKYLPMQIGHDEGVSYFIAVHWPALTQHVNRPWSGSSLAMAWLMSSPTRKMLTTPMTLCHIMMAGSDPLIFYAGFSENSKYQKMEEGQSHPFFGGKRQQRQMGFERNTSIKYID